MKKQTMWLIIGTLGIAGLYFLLKKEKMLIEDFEDINKWRVDSGSLESDTINFKQGSQGLKFISGGGRTASIASKEVNLDLSFMDFPKNNLTFWMYIHDLSTFKSLVIYFTSTNFKSFMSINIQANKLNEGWNKIILNKDYFINFNGESWQNIMSILRFMVIDNGISTSVTIDDLKQL